MKPSARALPVALSALSMLLTVGCAKEVVHQESQTVLGYHFSYFGCDTGEHKFDSKDAMCAGLQDSAPGGINHGCATSQRSDYFTSQGCPGTF